MERDRPADRLAEPAEQLADVVPLPGRAAPLREVVGDELRDERHRQERSLAEVAERAAVSLPYLSEVERGRKEASSDVLAAICDALELPLPVLLDRCAQRYRADGVQAASARAALTLLAA